MTSSHDPVVRGERGGVPFFAAEAPPPFVYMDGSTHTFVVERGPVSMRLEDEETLALLVDGEWITLISVEPKGKAAEIARHLESWSQTPDL